jgi:hypothetical protein
MQLSLDLGALPLSENGMNGSLQGKLARLEAEAVGVEVRRRARSVIDFPGYVVPVTRRPLHAKPTHLKPGHAHSIRFAEVSDYSGSIDSACP